MILIRLVVVSCLLFASSTVAFADVEVVGQIAVSSERKPMIFFVAKGAPDSCGPGCNTWISMHGYIDAAASTRFRRFLSRVGKRDLPIFIHSPGGNALQALALGRIIHARKARTVVGLTIPDACEGNGLGAVCDAQRKPDRDVPSRVGHLATCSSGCVFVFMAGKTREIPAGAILNVHGVGATFSRPVPQAVFAAAIKRVNRIIEGYVREVGGDVELARFASAVPHEFYRTLSREQIRRFRLDTRDVSDTGWFSSILNGRLAAEVRVYRNGWVDDGNFTELGLRISCGPQGQNFIEYFARANPSSSVQRKDVVLSWGEHKVRLPPPEVSQYATLDARATLLSSEIVSQIKLATTLSIGQDVDGTEAMATPLRQVGFAGLMDRVISGCASGVAIHDMHNSGVLFGAAVPGVLSPFGVRASFGVIHPTPQGFPPVR